MGHTVRVMRETDLEPARWVVYLAYSRVLAELYGAAAAATYEVRSLAYMRTYLQRESEGCFVAEAADGEIIGANFGFVWGNVGWFGSLAVHPDHQGRGAGQALVRAAMEYQRSRRCSRLGLETWPDSELVRHLYGKLGYETTFVTEKLSRPLVPRPPPAGHWVARWLSDVGAARAADLLAAARAVAQSAEPGLDYSREIETWTRAGMGDLLVLWTADPSAPPVPAAFALCLMVRPSGMPHEHLDVRALCVDPQLGSAAPAALDAALAAAERYAIARGRRGITVDVSLRYAGACELLHERGFRAVSQLIRMEQRGDGGPLWEQADSINCARWAG